MAWTIEYLNSAKKQLRKLDPQVSDRLIRFMRERVLGAGDPYALEGSLTGQWAGYWRCRVGDYRVICEIRDETMIVIVVKAATEARCTGHDGGFKW